MKKRIVYVTTDTKQETHQVSGALYDQICREERYRLLLFKQGFDGVAEWVSAMGTCEP